jgi:hypothetical protein
MWTDGRTDMTKLIAALSSFANAHKHLPSHPVVYNVHAQSTLALVLYESRIPIVPTGSNTSILNQFVTLCRQYKRLNIIL